MAIYHDWEAAQAISEFADNFIVFATEALGADFDQAIAKAAQTLRAMLLFESERRDLPGYMAMLGICSSMVNLLAKDPVFRQPGRQGQE
jgi:hypothetical protein